MAAAADTEATAAGRSAVRRSPGHPRPVGVATYMVGREGGRDVTPGRGCEGGGRGGHGGTWTGRLTTASGQSSGHGDEEHEQTEISATNDAPCAIHCREKERQEEHGVDQEGEENVRKTSLLRRLGDDRHVRARRRCPCSSVTPSPDPALDLVAAHVRFDALRGRRHQRRRRWRRRRLRQKIFEDLPEFLLRRHIIPTEYRRRGHLRGRGRDSRRDRAPRNGWGVPGPSPRQPPGGLSHRLVPRGVRSALYGEGEEPIFLRLVEERRPDGDGDPGRRQGVVGFDAFVAVVAVVVARLRDRRGLFLSERSEGAQGENPRPLSLLGRARFWKGCSMFHH